MTSNPIITFESVEKRFGSQVILKNLNFSLEQGKFYSIIGASGSGKTTTLRLINGLLKPEVGQVKYQNQALDYNNIVSLRRQMGYSIQGSGLFPHMNVIDNISIIARRLGWSKEKIKKRSKELLHLVNMEPELYLTKRPHQLSGGQQQRVGIVRSLFMKPELILMDEPFGALDPITRVELQDEVLRLQEELKLTIILVTHDLSEAFKLSNELLILNEGHLAAKGRPRDLILKSKDSYVKEFLSSHSPAQVLKNIKIYSVMYSSPYITRHMNDKYVVRELEGEEEQTFNSLDEVCRLHRDSGQMAVIMTDENRVYKAMVDAKRSASNERVDVPSISPLDNFLSGLNILLENDLDAIPVTNKDGVVVGSFSEEAIREI